MKFEKHPRRDGQQGSVAPTVAVLIVVLIGAVAFSLDMGNLYRVRNELQTAADAAALAAAAKLDGEDTGIAAAKTAASYYASKNWANDDWVTIESQDVVFGHWKVPGDPEEMDQWTDYGTNPDAANIPTTNAVKVLTQRSKDRNDSVKNFFAPILGMERSDVRADAIAIGGGPLNVECSSPLVLGDECEYGDNIDGICDACIEFVDDTEDNGGWTSFAGNNGVPDIAQALVDVCFVEGTTLNGANSYENAIPVIDEDGECAGNCTDHEAGEEIKAANGNMFSDSSSGKNVCQVIQHILCRGPADETCTNPQPFSFKSPVIDGCKFSADNGHPIVGFSTITIYGAKCGNSSDAVVADNSADCTFSKNTDKFLIAEITCDMEPEGVAGTGFYGVPALHPRLVE